MFRMLFTSLLYLATAVAPAQKKPPRLIWHPVYSIDLNTSVTTEGIYLSFENVTIVSVTVEGQADGKALPIAKGRPDADTSFLPAPIRNLDTYKLLKLTVDLGQREWVIRNPIAGKYYELGVK